MGIFNITHGGIDDGIYYSRRGQRITRWEEDLTPPAGASILTGGTIVYNLAVGETIMVSQMQYGLESVSDNVEFMLAWCTAANGGGLWFQVDLTYQINTPAALLEPVERSVDFIPPHRLRYDDGVRSVTIRIVANDASTVINCGWDGWSDGCGEGTTTSTSTSTTSTSTTSTSSSTTSTSSSTTSTSSSTTSTSSSTTSTSSSSSTSTSTTSTSSSTSTSTTSTSSSTTSTSSSTTSTSTTSTSSSTTSTSTTSTSSSTTSTSSSTTLRPD